MLHSKYARLFALLILLLPAATQAQWNTFVGYGAGLIVAEDASSPNVAMALKAGRENNWLQLGLGAETGIYNALLNTEVDMYRNGQYLRSGNWFNRYRIASPFVTPHIFGHYKLNIPEKGYAYGGFMWGLMTGKSDLYASGNMTKLTGGLNVGICFDINEHVSFEIGHKWRQLYINKVSPLVTGDPATGDYTINYISNLNLWYTIHTVNLLVRL